jgi:opacity protein-like surface antigen
MLVLLTVSSRPAFADATLFIGSTTTPSSHTTKGFAIGAGLLIVGVEFEYASATEDPLKAVPALRTGMGNVYVQTPIAIAGMQFYATTGAGGYREKLGTAHQETNIGFNTGGGVKVSLLGPLKARLDYRVIKLRGAPLYSVLHRVYAGVNLAF